VVTKLVGTAMVFILALGLVWLGDRLGLLGPGSRRWQTWLYATGSAWSSLRLWA
jgi:hypothetical protein